MTNILDYTFKSSSRDFISPSDEKVLRRLRKLEAKRVKKGETKYNKEVKKVEKKGGQWFYEGI